MLHVHNYVERGQQCSDLHILQTLPGDVDVQTIVHVDSSYPHQSKARIEVWNPSTMSWNLVSHLIEVPCENYLMKEEAAHEAAEELLARAVALLIG